MMATQDATRKRANATVVTAAEQAEAPARYNADRYGWAAQQAGLLREGRLSEIDAPNIAEELDDAGNEQYDKLESALTVLLMHQSSGITSPRSAVAARRTTFASSAAA